MNWGKMCKMGELKNNNNSLKIRQQFQKRTIKSSKRGSNLEEKYKRN